MFYVYLFIYLKKCYGNLGGQLDLRNDQIQQMQIVISTLANQCSPFIHI